MIGLDIDPNGDADSLRDYTLRYGYYGLYAQSPPDMTSALVNQFGPRSLPGPGSPHPGMSGRYCTDPESRCKERREPSEGANRRLSGMTLSDLTVAFVAGLLSPSGPPASFPSIRATSHSWHHRPVKSVHPRARMLLGIIAGTGILAAMLGFGLIVGVIFTLPIGGVLSVVSPIAYAILGGIGILLIIGAGPALSFRMPDVITGRAPFVGAFVFGLFFGVLILPCNAGPVTVLLALSTSAADFAANMGNFLMYGAGMAIPLIILSALSSYESTRITRTLAAQKRWINFATGVLMIAVAAYYLLVVFRIQDWGVPLQNTSLLREGSTKT